MIARKHKLYNKDEKDEIREMMIASAKYANSLSDFSDFELAPAAKQPRTRRRLDNLTPDEKVRRKKLKNREAAQTSRDKKKAYVNSLETTIRTLRSQNGTLTTQVLTLLSEKDELQKKTERLEKELRELGAKQGASGSAAPLPLQKEPALISTPLSSLLTAICWIWMTLTGSATWSTLPTLKSSERSQTPSTNKLLNWRRKLTKQWWGPNQKAWNPLAPNLEAVMKSLFW